MLSLRSFLPLSALALLPAALALGCAAETSEDDVVADEEADLSSSCKLDATCGASQKVLAAKLFSAEQRAPARRRADIRVDVSSPSFEAVPRVFAQKTTRTFTFGGGKKVLLSGSADGTKPVEIDDFLLVEVLAADGSLLAAGHLGGDAGISVGATKSKLLATHTDFKVAPTDIAALLPKDRPFRLRLSGLDSLARALVSDVFLVAADAPPPAPSACSTDAQCGGGAGASMCLLGRCVTVSESSFATDLQGTSVDAAFTAAGELRVAYQSWLSGGTWTLWEGPFGAATSKGSDASKREFLYDHAPGQDPVLASSWYQYTGGGVSYGAWAGPRLGYHERIGTFAVARSAGGTLFAAFTGYTPAPTNSYRSDRCTLFFATRPATGAWSANEVVDACSSGGLRNLAVHVRKDGGADILAAPEFGSVLRYHRENPIDPWAKNVLVAGTTSNTRPAFVFHRGGDGTTHVVAQPFDFTSDASKGDYSGTYLEIGDDGPVRTIALSKHRTQYRMPFPDLGTDADGNVYVQKRPFESYDRPSVVRIDRQGNVTERSLGLAAAGSWRASSLAVAPNGELALVHHGDGRNVQLRRFVPVR